VVHVSATVQADVTLLNNRNNNELFIINLATVPADRISIIPPAQSRTVRGNVKEEFTDIAPKKQKRI